MNTEIELTTSGDSDSLAGDFTEKEEADRVLKSIASVEEAISLFQAEVKQKTSFFEAENEELLCKIQKAKIVNDTELSRLRQNNVEKLQRLQEGNDSELASTKQKIEDFCRQKSQFQKHHHNSIYITKEAERQALIHELEDRKSAAAEERHNTTVERETRKADVVHKEVELKTEIELLDSAIREIINMHHKDLQNATLRIERTKSQFEALYDSKRRSIEEMRSSLHKQTKESEVLVKEAERQASAEKTQMKNELDSLTERTNNMERNFQKMQFSNQLDIKYAKEDITSLMETIKIVNNNINLQVEKTKEQLSALQTAEEKNIQIDHQIDLCKSSITKSRSEREEMKKERAKYESLLYTAQLSRFSFH